MKRVTFNFLTAEIEAYLKRVEITFQSVRGVRTYPTGSQLEGGACRYLFYVKIDNNERALQFLVFESMTEIQGRLNKGKTLTFKQENRYSSEFHVWTA